MLSVYYAACHKQAHSDQCHYAECRGVNLQTIFYKLDYFTT